MLQKRKEMAEWKLLEKLHKVEIGNMDMMNMTDDGIIG